MYRKRNKELEVMGLYTANYAGKHYVREISKRSKLPLKTTQTALKELEKKSILKSQITGKHKYYQLNMNNALTKLYLLQAEIQRTIAFLEKYPLIKTFIKEIESNASVIVFGSFAKGTADRDADIDLLVIAKEEQKLPLHLLPHKVHEIKLTEASFIKAIEREETLVKEIEENHIIISDHSHYVERMWHHYGK